MNREITFNDITKAMSPASYTNSRYAGKIKDAFSGLTPEECSGTKAQMALEYASSVGALATALGYTSEHLPSLDGKLDFNANHMFGSEIKLTLVLPELPRVT